MIFLKRKRKLLKKKKCVKKITSGFQDERQKKNFDTLKNT